MPNKITKNMNYDRIVAVGMCTQRRVPLSALFIRKNCLFQDTEVHITYEDQKKINKFARFNAGLHDFKEELEEKKV